MTKKEIVEKNIGLTFDFLRYLVDNPKLIRRIPDKSEIVFIGKEDPVKITSRKNLFKVKVGHVFEPVKE